MDGSQKRPATLFGRPVVETDGLNFDPDKFEVLAYEALDRYWNRMVRQAVEALDFRGLQQYLISFDPDADAPAGEDAESSHD
jgi:hypothetical protein